MPTRDNATNTKEVSAFTQATVSASADGITIDNQGYDRVSFCVYAGPSGDTLSGTVKLEFDIAESADGTTWNYAGDYDLVVPTPQSYTHEGIGIANGAANSGAFFVASSNTPLALVGGVQPTFTGGYIGTKRYIRLHVHVTGTQTNGTPIRAEARLTGASRRPVYSSAS